MSTPKEERYYAVRCAICGATRGFKAVLPQSDQHYWIPSMDGRLHTDGWRYVTVQVGVDEYPASNNYKVQRICPACILSTADWQKVRP